MGYECITPEEFKTWYFSRWKGEKKPDVYMSEELMVAVQCNVALYPKGAPEGAASHTIKKEIEGWLNTNHGHLSDKAKARIRLVVKPV